MRKKYESDASYLDYAVERSSDWDNGREEWFRIGRFKV